MTVDIEKIVLCYGSHVTASDGMCAMEAVAFIAGEPHSDHPKCACPVIAAFMRVWNDKLPDDLRQELIKPLLLKVVESRSTTDIQDRRVILIADWTQRVVLPLWMDLARLDATQLRGLPEAKTVASLEDGSRMEIVKDAMSQCAAARAAEATTWDAARAAAWAIARTTAEAAAWDAARAAAWDAARAAAWAIARTTAEAAAWDDARANTWDVARDAAWNAARAAAEDAARATARATAWDAAWAAAWAALNETKIAIWKTCPALIERLLLEKERPCMKSLS